MRKKTFKEKGLAYVSKLALENSRALKALVQWNHEHGIRFFRSHPSYCALHTCITYTYPPPLPQTPMPLKSLCKQSREFMWAAIPQLAEYMPTCSAQAATLWHKQGLSH